MTVLLPIEALLVMAALRIGTAGGGCVRCGWRQSRCSRGGMMLEPMVALLLMAVRRMGVADSLRAVRLKAVALLAWGADAVT